MTEEEVYEGIKEFFEIEELVGPIVYKKYKQTAWRFLCPRLLETILILRKSLDSPFTVNTWKQGGVYDERGLRDNKTDILKNRTLKGKLYLSAHIMGKALDFKVEGMTSEQVRMWIVTNADKFPYRLRLEHNKNGKPISWVHLDVHCDIRKPKVYLFNI